MEAFLNRPNYPLFALLIFSIIFIRYLISSYAINWLVRKVYPSPVFKGNYKKGQIAFEIKNGFVTSLVFALGFVHLYYLTVNGHTLLLSDNRFSLGYHLLSILIAMLMHETYYYWLHRLMHINPFYKWFHKGHHHSIIVSSFTSFSFDFLESIMQLFFFYILLFTLPIHLYSLLFMLIFMTISAVINHLNFEVFPEWFFTTFPFNQFIGATHHALHHKEYRTNYGLYFTFWDKIMGTESPNYTSQVIPRLIKDDINCVNIHTKS